MRLWPSALVLVALVALSGPAAFGWSNGRAGNATTNRPFECDDPPYATHDWIADHALALLPDEEKAWLVPHKRLYFLGTEAPDNDDIPDACGAPNTGYDDRTRALGHGVKWRNNWTEMFRDRPARRAQEEYGKAVSAYLGGDHGDAAFYLGAMTHYISEVGQYGHNFTSEKHHVDYEDWARNRTDHFNDGHFESYIQLDQLVRRTPYTATKRISKATGGGRDQILSASEMDRRWDNKDQAYLDSVGHTLNMAVNELADVLHTFFLNVVSEEQE
jgi:hypothetical protein